MAELMENLDEAQSHCSSDTADNCALPDTDAAPSFALQEKVLVPHESIKLEFPKGVTTAQQQKRELYYKLDTILITALQNEFEVWPGHTVDRQDMVEYLRGIVLQHMNECPELEKILSLRDTVLTGRVKRAFPGVEYKRKQMRQDHYRKAWLYVNIRRKSSPFADPVKGGTMIRSSVTTTSTWMPPVVPESMVVRQSPLNSKISVSEDQVFPCPNSITSPASSPGLDTSTDLHATPYAVDHDSSDDELNDAGISLGSENCGFSRERSALVLDNYTIAKWVRSKYSEENASYVPVQDVVKAFKDAFSYDISYKECHQMIYAAFTNSRNRGSLMKTVRVSSMGQQYIYRGISAINPEQTESETNLADGAQNSHNTPGHIQDEREEVWKRMVEDLKQERDQSVLERNQALVALIKLEKNHAQALTTADQRPEGEEQSEGPERQRENSAAEPAAADPVESRHGTSSLDSKSKRRSSLSHLLRNFGRCCEKCGSEEKSYERLKDERDLIWKDIVTHAQRERDSMLRRLDIVKQERDCYLERLHALEKENQRLRDAVNAGCSEPRSYRPVADISSSWPPKTDFTSNNDETKEALSSVLSHLRSKRAGRKQAVPSRFHKVQKLNNPKAHGENSDETVNEHKASDEMTPFIVHSGSTPPESPDELIKSNSPDVDEAVDLSRTERGNGEESDCNNSKNDKKLNSTEDSNMFAFRRHPLDD